jgi:hypothetical protein
MFNLLLGWYCSSSITTNDRISGPFFQLSFVKFISLCERFPKPSFPTNSFSICSRDFPFISVFNTNKRYTKHKKEYIKNEYPSKCDSSKISQTHYSRLKQCGISAKSRRFITPIHTQKKVVRLWLDFLLRSEKIAHYTLTSCSRFLQIKVKLFVGLLKKMKKCWFFVLISASVFKNK